jgi:hypothetical protein
MARRTRLSEAIPDTAEKAGWWAMGFGTAGTLVALMLNDFPLSVFGFLAAAAGGLLPSVAGLKRERLAPPPKEEWPQADLDAYVREMRIERGELLVIQEDQAARDRLH